MAPKEWTYMPLILLTDGLDVEFIPEVDLSHRRRVIRVQKRLNS